MDLATPTYPVIELAISCRGALYRPFGCHLRAFYVIHSPKRQEDMHEHRALPRATTALGTPIPPKDESAISGQSQVPPPPNKCNGPVICSPHPADCHLFTALQIVLPETCRPEHNQPPPKRRQPSPLFRLTSGCELVQTKCPQLHLGRNSRSPGYGTQDFSLAE